MVELEEHDALLNGLDQIDARSADTWLGPARARESPVRRAKPVLEPLITAETGVSKGFPYR